MSFLFLLALKFAIFARNCLFISFKDKLSVDARVSLSWSICATYVSDTMSLCFDLAFLCVGASF